MTKRDGEIRKNLFSKFINLLVVLVLLLALIQLLNHILPKTIMKEFFKKRADYCYSFTPENCPKNVCELGNIGGGPGLGYAIGCTPKMTLF